MLMAVNERSVGPWARRPTVRFGAVLAVAVAAAVVVWLVVNRDDSNDPSAESARVTAIAPVPASPDRLRELSVDAGRPIYWLGAWKNRTYELTRTAQDRIFVRYLPRGVAAGSREAKYTLVGTYPVDNAYGVLRDLAKAGGESSFTAPKGGLAVYSPEHPTNIYLAYPGADVQIEVYASSAEHARELITSGQVVPVS